MQLALIRRSYIINEDKYKFEIVFHTVNWDQAKTFPSGIDLKMVNIMSKNGYY